ATPRGGSRPAGSTLQGGALCRGAGHRLRQGGTGVARSRRPPSCVPRAWSPLSRAGEGFVAPTRPRRDPSMSCQHPGTESSQHTLTSECVAWPADLTAEVDGATDADATRLVRPVSDLDPT